MEKNTALIFTCLSDWLSCLSDIKKNQNDVDYDLQQIRLRLVKALERFERQAAQCFDNNAQLMKAKYAMTALSDEYVICSQAGQRSSWLSNPLQLQLFGDVHAGEHFFELLSELRLDARSNAAVLEIYLLCLELGYRGQYLFRDEFQLKKLKVELQQQLLALANNSDSKLAEPLPEWIPLQEKKMAEPISRKLLAVSLGALLILTLVLSTTSWFRAWYSRHEIKEISGSILKSYQQTQGKK